MTLVSIAMILLAVPPILEWAVLHAVWNAGSLEECRQIIAAAHGEGASGACWAVINERIYQLLFGFYPPDLYWRPILALILLATALAPVMFAGLPRRMLWFTALYPVIGYCLLCGVSPQDNEFLSSHLSVVGSWKFGGLLLVITVAAMGIAAAIPIGIAFELGRTSSLLILRWVSSAAIEIFRGVPVLVLLITSSVALNYFLPPSTSFDLVLRAALIAALITGAYIAEAIRAGFAALPWSHYEAAAALGLSYRKAMWLIIWPQIIRNTMPRIVIACTGLVRDISIVAVIGFLDPIGLLNPIRADSNWNGLYWELFVVVALLYGVPSYVLSLYAAYLDKRLDPDNRGRAWLGWR
jgi:general L-amino acid transport system permease protein